MPHTSEHLPREAVPLWRDKWLLAGLLAFFGIGFLLFPGAGRDDAYITYWPAYSLAELGSLANYNGDAVEQSSSLTLVLLLAALRFITGAPLAWLGWLLGTTCGALTITLCSRFANSTGLGRARIAPLCLALAAPFTYWSFSGMETPLQALLISAWVLAAARLATCEERGHAILRLLPVTAALVLVRPEAMFVLLCVTAGATVLARASTPQFRSALWITLGTCAGVLVAVRALGFDSWLPQPAIAKAGRPLAETTALGWHYLTAQPLATSLSILAIGTGFWRGLRGKADARLILASLFISAQVGFVLFSGGDWMEGARFLAPTLPLCFVLLLDATSKRALHWALAVVLGFASLQFSYSKSRSLTAWQSAEIEYHGEVPRLTWFETKNLVHLRDEPTLVALEQILATIPNSQETVILTGQGGFVLYHLVREHPNSLRVVDRYGLLDRSLGSSPTALQNGSSALGLNLSYAALLRDWDAIMQEAHIQEPHIIFDVGIGNRDAQGLAERGYVEVYRQSGELVVGAKRQPAKQVIFIKQELAAGLSAERLENFEFSGFQPK